MIISAMLPSIVLSFDDLIVFKQDGMRLFLTCRLIPGQIGESLLASDFLS